MHVSMKDDAFSLSTPDACAYATKDIGETFEVNDRLWMAFMKVVEPFILSPI